MTPKQRASLARKPPYFHNRLSTTDKVEAHASSLSKVKQKSFVELNKMYPREALRYVQKIGFTPPAAAKLRSCWKCHGPVKAIKEKDDWCGASGSWLRCKSKACRTKIAPTAFTLIHKTQLTYKDMLGLAFLFAIGTRVDQASHISGYHYKVVERFFFKCKVVTAFAEWQAGQQLEVHAGECEVDCAKFGVVDKGKEQCKHVGRMLAMCDRGTASRVMAPLPSRRGPAGRNQGAEAFVEVHPILSRTFKPGSVQVSDSARAFVKSAKARGTPSGIVNHTKGQFSAFAKVPLAGASPELIAVARERSSSSSNSMRLTVSTNFVEGFIGNTKTAMNKKGLLGGGASRRATLNTMSTAWFVKHQGVEALGKAMKTFMHERLDQTDPLKFFDESFLSE